MGTLKDNIALRNRLKGNLSTLLDNLDNLEESKSERFIKWCQEKSTYYRDGILKNKYNPLPNAMKRGDIVMCELGINIPPEFGNDGTGKHFVIIWGQQGHNMIIIPTTKQKPPVSNIYTIELGLIDGMPPVTTYAKLDAIREVSLRRISKVFGQPDGKIYDETIIRKINNGFKNLFIIKDEDIPK